MKKTRGYLMIAVVGLTLALGSVPALAAGYGSIVPNSGVTLAFERYEADPDINYYHSGSDVGPDAIIGVNKAYTLDSNLWKKCTSPADFKNHVSAMQNFATTRANTSLHGFIINDDRGMKIGVEYSPLNTPTFVRRVSEKAVDIPTPNYQNRMSTLYNSY